MILPAADPSGARKVILVVEDEVLIRMVVADYLRDWGYQVVEAGNADEALDHLRVMKRVDLIFSDVQMPGSMGGLELVEQVRALYPSVPIILASGHLMPAEAGETSLLPKPYELASVVEKVRKLLPES
jgi:CheY-like chemotaxis protein